MKKGLVVFLATLMSMSTITSFAGEYDTDKNSEQFEQKSNNEDFEKIEKKLKLYKIIKDRSYYDNKEGIELDDYLESYIGNEIIEQSDWLKEYARKNNISGNINIHRTGEEYIKKWVQEGDNKKITRAEALYSILKLILTLCRYKHPGIVHVILLHGSLRHGYGLLTELLLGSHKNLAPLINLLISAVRLQDMRFHIVLQLYF